MELLIPKEEIFALRPYQQQQKEECYDLIRKGSKKILMQLSTGGGKTVLYSDIARDCAAKGKRTLVLAHRNELITQGADKVQSFAGIKAGIVKAGIRPRPDSPIQIASIQTIHSRKEKYKPGFFDFGLVIIDECHRSLAKTYQDILAECGNPIVLGFTATPIRGDGQGLGDIYQNIVTGIPTKELIELGALSKYKLFACGDGLSDSLHPKNAVANYQEHADGKQCIVFCNGKAHSLEVERAYQEAGYSAKHLDANTSDKDRSQAIKDFASKKLQILLNYGLFIEGLDIPGIEVVQIMRDVKSISSYLQMLGRGLRPAPGKEYAIFLIHSDCHKAHGHPSDPRVWTLDGVEKREPRSTRIIDPDEIKLVEPEPEPVSQLFLNMILKDVTEGRDEIIGYITEIKRLIQQFDKMGKNPGWIYDLVIKLKPPAIGWYYYAEACNMPRSWADQVIAGISNGSLHQLQPPRARSGNRWQKNSRIK